MTSLAAASRPNVRPTDPDAARLSALPAAAREKFDKLRRRELRARALADGLSDAIDRARETRDGALRVLALHDRQYPMAEFLAKEDPETGEGRRVKSVPADFPEREVLVERVAAAKAELQRLQDERNAANLGYNTTSILEWLAAQSPSARFVVTKSVARPANVTEALARNEVAQAAARDQLAAAENARATVAEAKTKMREEIEHTARVGRPGVAGLFHDGQIEWPTKLFTANGRAGETAAIVAETVADTLALLVWTNKAAIIAALDAEIERAGDDKSALNAAAKAARVAECEASLLRLQREAESLICAFEDQGGQIKRSCADPLVLLAIEAAR